VFYVSSIQTAFGWQNWGLKLALHCNIATTFCILDALTTGDLLIYIIPGFFSKENDILYLTKERTN
jgi:hypothetical protein